MEFNVGDIVWAKLKGYSHWPSEIIVLDHARCQVRFLGDNKTAELKVANIKSYRSNFTQMCHKLTKKQFVRAVEESFSYGDLHDLEGVYENTNGKKNVPNTSSVSEIESVDSNLIKRLHSQVQLCVMAPQDQTLFKKCCSTLSTSMVGQATKNIPDHLINCMILTFCKLIYMSCDNNIPLFKSKVSLYLKGIKNKLLSIEELTRITYDYDVGTLSDLESSIRDQLQDRANYLHVERFFAHQNPTYQFYLTCQYKYDKKP